MDFATLGQHILYKTQEISGGQKIESLKVFEENVSEYSVKLLEYFKGLGYHFKHAQELITFCEFVWNLKNVWNMPSDEISESTDFFLFDYTIPQIGKEFDLLRFGANYNINIELKSSTTIEAQKKQLERNAFYLKFLPVNTKYYSISPKIDSYIEYDISNKSFRDINPLEFISVLSNQIVDRCSVDEANSFFEIKNYLVSPFNDVEKFLEDRYFLNGHQSDIVDDIMKKNLSVQCFGIKGNPGTGKTLLTYHIAKKLKQGGKNVVILHGANLNDGQEKLIKAGYDIVPIRNFDIVMDAHRSYDYIILDEGQRLRNNQIEKLFGILSTTSSKFIISLDGKQTLDRQESKENAENILKFIKSNGGKIYSLKDKFRSNLEMSKFIKLLLKHPLNESFDKASNKNNSIMIKYFENRNIADKYLQKMEENSEWQVLNYTKSRFTREKLDNMVDCGKISHEIIGQEFDNVIVPMDNNFYYRKKDAGKKEFQFLDVEYSYYPLREMFYQNITRTRNKLQIVVIANYKLFDDLCYLMSHF